MLKITPYLGILVVIVSVAGLWFPKLGFFLVLIFLSLMLISPFMGRWFCGNLCPRGSFNDFWVGKISRYKRIPKFFASYYLRIPVFILLMGFMILRLLNTGGFINKIGMVFVIMCLSTTLIALVLGITIAPRAWCTFCPMGFLQRLFGGQKYKLQVKESLCTNCGKCQKICPMHLSQKEIKHHPDCIKCERCVEICPKNALYFA